MATATSSTIVGVFRDRAHAEQAVDELVNSGIQRDHISVVAADKRNIPADTPNLLPNENIGADMNTGTGAAMGGFFGFIVGIAALAIPGIGPILAVGPLAAGLMGAGIGAAAGGLAGALKGMNVPEDDAKRFADAVRAGGILVTAHVPDDRADKAADVLDSNGAVGVEEDYDINAPAAPIGRVTNEGVRAAQLSADEGVRARQKDREGKASIYPGITGSGDVTSQLR